MEGNTRWNRPPRPWTLPRFRDVQGQSIVQYLQLQLQLSKAHDCDFRAQQHSWRAHQVLDFVNQIFAFAARPF